MSDSTITFVVLAAVVAVFVWDRVPVAIVAVGVALRCGRPASSSYDQALAGFGDPTVIFIASLFVVSEGLDATGVTAWAGQQLIARAGESRTRLVVLTMLLVAVLTMLISVNGSVAALVPVAVVTAVRLGRSPSQLLLPLAFAAHAGSLLALTGTPVNVIVSEPPATRASGRSASSSSRSSACRSLIGHDRDRRRCSASGCCPTARPRTIPPDFSEHARTLVDAVRARAPRATPAHARARASPRS